MEPSKHWNKILNLSGHVRRRISKTIRNTRLSQKTGKNFWSNWPTKRTKFNIATQTIEDSVTGGVVVKIENILLETVTMAHLIAKILFLPKLVKHRSLDFETVHMNLWIPFVNDLGTPFQIKILLYQNLMILATTNSLPRDILLAVETAALSISSHGLEALHSSTVFAKVCPNIPKKQLLQYHGHFH